MTITNTDTNIYAASCNPSRRAKRLRSESLADLPSSSSASRTHPSIPKSQPKALAHDSRDSTPSGSATPAGAATSGSLSWRLGLTNDIGASPVMAPTNDGQTQKRGRKATTRAAREAQRKLNHSMIEKVRRTKINEALATLKSLVPVDYGQTRVADEDGDVEEDGEGADDSRPCASNGRRKPAKGISKKDEKEREYKLEILVRTVSFVQDLVEKVKVLETDRARDVCPNCGGGGDTSFSSRNLSPSSSQSGKRKRTQSNSDGEGSKGGKASKYPSPEITRLPSISSWLSTDSHTNAGVHHHPSSSSSMHAFHLPSPPSSTLVDPVKSTLHPPTLTLDLPLTNKSSVVNPFSPRVSTTLTPLATPITANGPASPQRTPEDEYAASMLLQISNSPPSYPVRSSSISTTSPFSASFELPKAANMVSSAASSSGSSRLRPLAPSTYLHSPLQAQTPSSLLGLDRSTQRRHS